MAYADKEDQRRAARKHYEENRQQYIDRAAAHKKLTRARVREYLHVQKARPCADCGGSYPYYVMQFDHVRGQKVFDLGGATGRTLTVERVAVEAAKCDVVCANCHAERTHQRGYDYVAVERPMDAGQVLF